MPDFSTTYRRMYGEAVDLSQRMLKRATERGDIDIDAWHGWLAAVVRATSAVQTAEQRIEVEGHLRHVLTRLARYTPHTMELTA